MNITRENYKLSYWCTPVFLVSILLSIYSPSFSYDYSDAENLVNIGLNMPYVTLFNLYNSSQVIKVLSTVLLNVIYFIQLKILFSRYEVARKYFLLFYLLFPAWLIFVFPSKTALNTLAIISFINLIASNSSFFRNNLGSIFIFCFTMNFLIAARIHVVGSIVIILLSLFMDSLTQKIKQMRLSIISTRSKNILFPFTSQGTAINLLFLIVIFSLLVSSITKTSLYSVSLVNFMDFEQQSSFFTQLSIQLLKNPFTALLGIILSSIVYLFAPILNPNYWFGLFDTSLTLAEIGLMLSSFICTFSVIKIFCSYNSLRAKPSVKWLIIALVILISTRSLFPFSQHRYIMPYVPLIFLAGHSNRTTRLKYVK